MDVSARNDVIAALVVLAIVAVFGPMTADIFVHPLDPGFSSRDFPIGVLSLMAILALVMLVRAVVRLANTGWRLYEPGEAEPLLRYLVPAGLLGFVYVWLLEQFQYPLPTVFMLSIAMAIFGNGSFSRLVVVPVIVTVIFYVVFYGVFGLNEAPGEILRYDNQWYFRPMREFLGLM